MNLNQTTDLSAEMAVLGSILLKPDVLDEITFLEPRDFSSRRNELIFRVMRYLHERDRPVDLVTITEHFQKHNRLEDMGGVIYLTELAGATPSAANIRHYAEIVRSKAHRRRGHELAQKIIAATEDDYEDDEGYFAAVDALVDEIRPAVESEMVGFAETREEYFRHLRSRAEKLMSGFRQFDEWAGGLWRGWLFVLAGRPGAGKTAKALQYAYGVAKHNPDAGPVLIFSQEMDRLELIDRLVSMVAQVNYRRIINKGGEEGFTDNEWDRINRAYDEVSRLPIYIRDSAGVTIQEVRATARRFKKRYGKLAMVIVDYLQIMDIPQKKNETRAAAIGRVTSAAKQTARQLKCVFMLLSQLSRSSENRDEPKLSDLKESGAIEQDADVVEFLWDNGDMEGSAKVVQSIFAKGRNIGTRKFRLAFEWWIQRFVELRTKEESLDGKRTNRHPR
ncbi:replicative DNA helicase [Paenibacillus ginsengihumi]|uniref:replicative DNA helicase n=1 Tax=Paenibacillus ginsengihumi TaxID=431596 RepID=UPI00037E14FB|nr:replicative DNA helicase [Paenibacillus ginsengihumi]